jgi:ribonuclease D
VPDEPELAGEPVIVRAPDELARVARSASGAGLVAVDVEGNGLFAYRARLCTVQLAWLEGEATRIVIVDALATDCRPLAELLGPGGPPKVLHDFTFDVKLLADAGIVASNLRDTSVVARMLGRKATGLASLLASDLGIVVTKEMQQHDWSRRPLGAKEIEYLAGDVRYLAALHDKLATFAHDADIEPEIEAETAYKYEMALAPAREKRPAYLRIKGAEALDEVSLAVLRRLVDERERLAESWDVPPFKVAGNDLLLAMARSKPKSIDDLAQSRRGVSSRLLASGGRIVAAIVAGIADGVVPAVDRAPPPRLEKEAMAERRAREKRLTSWRKKEAAARGVDEQVVLPGHCLQDLLPLDGSDPAAIVAVRGLGSKRAARYAGEIAALLARPAADAPAEEPSATESKA